MGNLVLNGATSGATTITPTDAVTATLTLPSSTGTILTTANPQSGGVLQVVNATYSSQISSSSSTYADTNLTATITPKFTTSKILVCVQHNGCGKLSSTSAYIGCQVLRNSTSIALLAYSVGNNNSTSPNYIGGMGLDYLDSPATTSAVTYKTQFKSSANSASVYMQIDSEVSTITLMEIAA
jgi:hypothetical protein